MKKLLFLIILSTTFQSCAMLNVMDDMGRGTEAMKYKAMVMKKEKIQLRDSMTLHIMKLCVVNGEEAVKDGAN